jgi:ribonuclease E
VEAKEEPEPAPGKSEEPKKRGRKKAAVQAEAAPAAEAAEEEPAKPAKAPRKRKGKAAQEPAEAAPVPTREANNDTDESGEPLRSGWWQRTFG